VETHVVVKPFDGAPGVRFNVGQRVNANDWPNARTLVRMRFLRDLLATEVPRGQEGRGRKG